MSAPINTPNSKHVHWAPNLEQINVISPMNSVQNTSTLVSANPPKSSSCFSTVLDVITWPFRMIGKFISWICCCGDNAKDIDGMVRNKQKFANDPIPYIDQIANDFIKDPQGFVKHVTSPEFVKLVSENRYQKLDTSNTKTALLENDQTLPIALQTLAMSDIQFKELLQTLDANTRAAVTKARADIQALIPSLPVILDLIGKATSKFADEIENVPELGRLKRWIRTDMGHLLTALKDPRLIQKITDLFSDPVALSTLPKDPKQRNLIIAERILGTNAADALSDLISDVMPSLDKAAESALMAPAMNVLPHLIFSLVGLIGPGLKPLLKDRIPLGELILDKLLLIAKESPAKQAEIIQGLVALSNLA